MDVNGENAPIDRAGSADNLLPLQTPRGPHGGSNRYALKVAGLTVLACLLLASQVFVAYMVFDQKQQIQTLQKNSNDLKRELHSAQVAPIKMREPLNRFPLMHAFVDLEKVATEAPVKEVKKRDSVGMDEMIGLLEENFEMPKFNDTILANLQSLKKQLNESNWKSFEGWLRNWLIFQASQHMPATTKKLEE
ncbi:CD74 molecule, major histocompatibility complex, class II invariant chain a isoform X2 [Syngnathoides biaculeatus]|uniref:CD74 molecule, major histocompatibility complex, class II invariant chain a isoform X2 n=1 Tax=Syngnathoides biaculeatus TaxID=300417 RepID=UPI002ADD47E3|nr:CD74 molecule, major histocompatibility complex, class II invariant chain a isoform X2 [Syngnathoides biaculeatus]